MGMEMGIGLVFGVFVIWAGNIVRTKQAFAFLAGFRKRGNRLIKKD